LNDPWVASVDAVDVGVNLADIGLDGGGNGNCGKVAPASAESGDPAIGSFPLETGHNADESLLQVSVQTARSDIGDLGLRVHAVGDDPRLCPSERYALATEGIDRHGSESGGRLLAGGEQHVHFALCRIWGHVAGQLDQRVSDAAHGANHRDYFVSCIVSGHDPTGDIENAIGISDRCSAVFLYDKTHERSWTQKGRGDSRRDVALSTPTERPPVAGG
jgi:hypothetical protein